MGDWDGWGVLNSRAAVSGRLCASQDPAVLIILNWCGESIGCKRTTNPVLATSPCGYNEDVEVSEWQEVLPGIDIRREVCEPG